MLDNNANNKRIAKNTLLLYARMLYSLFISLFTSRVILEALGFEDYGLYNVVGSVVAMFIFLRSAMGNSVHRFITYALGKGDEKKLSDIFSMSLMIHTGLALLIVLLCETVGLWFLNSLMTIPEGREIAANWVFQFSVLSCALSVICVPYDAEIIAHERMGIFAVIQVLNSTLNLAIAYTVKYFVYDRLIFYALLLLLIQVLNRILYGVYCDKNFQETKFHWVKDKVLFKEMTSFAGWSLFGNMAYVGFTQGQNILLNIFFGPVVNAARGVAVSIQSGVKGFVTNFQMALNPQITKSYAHEDFERLHNLIYDSSKLSLCLLWCMVLPVFVEAEVLLQLWLNEVPQYASIFLRFIVIIMMFDALESPLSTAICATGRIKKYQIIEGSLLLFIIPISYCAILWTNRPEIVFCVHLCIVVLAQCVRVLFARSMIGLSASKYIVSVALPSFVTIAVSSFITFYSVAKIGDSTEMFLVKCVFCVIIAVGSSYVFALSKKERAFINNKIKGIIRK